MKKILMKKVLMKKVKYRTLTLQRIVEYNAKITAELLSKISSDSWNNKTRITYIIHITYISHITYITHIIHTV